jgi:hypothetical protein
MSMLAPEAPRARILELTSEEWCVLAFASAALVAVVAMVTPPPLGNWPAASVFFCALVVGHLCMTARRYVAFPDLIGVACCLQWVLAPWMSQFYPPNMLVFRMTMPPAVYLEYALPATIALWLGLQLPPARRLSKSWDMPELEPLSPRMRQMLDGVIAAGVIGDLYSGLVPPSIAFLLYLLTSLRFVGALGWMITRTPGWWWRVGLVMAIFVTTQTSGGMFYLVVHWGGFFLLVYAFMAKWRWKLGLLLVTSVFVMGTLQDVKPKFRQELNNGAVSGPIDSFTRLGAMMWHRVVDGDPLGDHSEIGDVLVRFNQGWIIARVITHVPAHQPYASGSTLLDAAMFSVVPRFLVPSKKEGASSELFTRYTGVELAGGTKMGLSIIGEMYANFGYYGGIAGTFVYGLVIGSIFLFFAGKAQKNPLWWAASSMVLLPSVEPGFNVEDIANHVVKAAVLLLLLWKLFPPMQRILSTAGADQASGSADEVSMLAQAVADH